MIHHASARGLHHDTTIYAVTEDLMYKKDLLIKITAFTPSSAEFLNKNLGRPKGFFQFEIIINVLIGSSRFIWKPMLWVYGH